jgi:hypothetical protein
MVPAECNAEQGHVTVALHSSEAFLRVQQDSRHPAHDHLAVFPPLDVPGHVAANDLADISANQTEWFRLTGPITYIGNAAVQRDIERLQSALSGVHVADAFVSAVKPVSRKSDRDVLAFYACESDYLYAVSDVMRQEYRAIADAGFILQLGYAALNPHEQILREAANPTDDELRRARELGVEIVNHARHRQVEDPGQQQGQNRPPQRFLGEAQTFGQVGEYPTLQGTDQREKQIGRRRDWHTDDRGKHQQRQVGPGPQQRQRIERCLGLRHIRPPPRRP